MFNNPPSPQERSSGNSPPSSPMLRGVVMEQGEDYNPTAEVTGEESSNLMDEIDEVFDEEIMQRQAFKINSKFLILIGTILAVIVGVIFLIIFIVSLGSKENEEPEIDPVFGNLDELLVEAPASSVASQITVPEPVTVPEPEPEPEPEPIYTVDEYDKMFQAGLSQEQIRALEIDKVDNVDKKIAEWQQSQKNAIQSYYRDILKQISNKEITDTWLSMPKQEIGSEEVDEYGSKIPPVVTTKTENVDYEKIPLHGSQCILKLIMDDGSTAFMFIHPTRYQSLEKNSGNIVVEYDYVVWRGAAFRTNIREVLI